MAAPHDDHVPYDPVPSDPAADALGITSPRPDVRRVALWAVVLVAVAVLAVVVPGAAGVVPMVALWALVFVAARWLGRSARGHREARVLIGVLIGALVVGLVVAFVARADGGVPALAGAVVVAFLGLGRAAANPPRPPVSMPWRARTGDRTVLLTAAGPRPGEVVQALRAAAPGELDLVDARAAVGAATVTEPVRVATNASPHDAEQLRAALTKARASVTVVDDTFDPDEVFGS